MQIALMYIIFQRKSVNYFNYVVKYECMTHKVSGNEWTIYICLHAPNR